MPTPAKLAPQIEQFLHDNRQGVMTSFRRNGMPQLSIVTVYPRDGGVGISITETRAKFKNLLRDPRCSARPAATSSAPQPGGAVRTGTSTTGSRLTTSASR